MIWDIDFTECIFYTHLFSLIYIRKRLTTVRPRLANLTLYPFLALRAASLPIVLSNSLLIMLGRRWEASDLFQGGVGNVVLQDVLWSFSSSFKYNSFRYMRCSIINTKGICCHQKQKCCCLRQQLWVQISQRAADQFVSRLPRLPVPLWTISKSL